MTLLKVAMNTTVLQPNPMEEHIFAFSLIIDGTTETVFQFIMPLKSIYDKNFGIIE